MVQRGSHTIKEIGILDWLRQLFRRTVIKSLPLSFEMEMNDAGAHVVRIYRQNENRREQVKNVRDLFDYGYHESVDTEQGRRVFRLAPDDRQILLSLKSLNPSVRPDGTLHFEIAPPQLEYLRTRQSVREGERSRTLKVASEPLEPIAEIAFDPARGLTVRTGYRPEGEETLLPHDALPRSADGEHIRIGNIFFRLLRPGAKALPFLEQPVHEVPLDDIPEFFQRDLVLLKKEFNAVLTDLAREIRVIRDPIEPVVHVRKDTPGWLDFQVEYRAGEITVPAHLLARHPGKPFIQLDPSTWVATASKAVERTKQHLEALGAEPTATGYRVPASEFVALEDFISSIGGRAEVSSAYEEFLAQLTDFRHNPTFELPVHIERQLASHGLTLRPYQRSGIHWLHWLYRHHLHGLLADDMGLGKTLQSICLLRLAYEESGSAQHSLIIAPKSVLHHWERELRHCYPERQIYRYHGPNRSREWLRADHPIIFISTYSTVANDVEHLSTVPFFFLILDEATYIKNPSAKRTRAIKALNAAHRLALSGTPVENRPAELWSIFDFLMRGHLGRFGTFQRHFEEAILEGDPGASEKLGRRVRPFLLRRLKEDVASDLPEKLEISEWCELTAEQRQLYGVIQAQARGVREALAHGEQVNYTRSVLPVLVHLKQLCDHPALITGEWEPALGRSEKFDWAVAKLEEIHQQGEQVVLFSHFLGMLDLLESTLQQKRIGYIRIDGSTSDRQSLIERFNSEGGPTVALCSLLAAGQGINMQAANHVIHVDRWWNPAIEDQATDRVHRLGQTRNVYVYRILVEGTLEERINDILEEKRDMTYRIIEAASGSGGWSRAELMELLRPLD